LGMTCCSRRGEVELDVWRGAGDGVFWLSRRTGDGEQQSGRDRPVPGGQQDKAGAEQRERKTRPGARLGVGGSTAREGGLFY
jgi:hypothetical protein